MMDEKRFDDAVRSLIDSIGEDPDREGLKGTPERMRRAWRDEVFSGYRSSISDLMKTFDSSGYDELVLVRDIEVFSTCEHHMLPFFGVAHVAYIPDGRILGTSKLARIVDVFSRRLQIQERLTTQVTETLMVYLRPRGAACVVEAQHLCMRMRGVSKQNSVMVTSSLKGEFMTDPTARNEFLSLIGRRQ
jgi:GTP cyclohydrolase I